MAALTTAYIGLSIIPSRHKPAKAIYMSIRSLDTFFYYLLFLIALLILPVRSQGLQTLQAQALAGMGNPVISGELGGMQVVVQGALIAFMVVKTWHGATLDATLDPDACAKDLHCTMQKNNTGAVVVEPEGVWIFDKAEPTKDIEKIVSGEPLLPSFLPSNDGLPFKPVNTPAITFIPTEANLPATTLATLNTGYPVIDKTPAIELFNSATLQWLSELVEWFGIRQSKHGQDEDEGLSFECETTTTDESQILTRINDEYSVRTSLLTSGSPLPTPQITRIEEKEGCVQMMSGTDTLIICPSSSSRYQTAGSYTVSMRQVPTGSNSTIENSSSGDTEPSPMEVEENNPFTALTNIRKRGRSENVNTVSGFQKKPRIDIGEGFLITEDSEASDTDTEADNEIADQICWDAEEETNNELKSALERLPDVVLHRIFHYLPLSEVLSMRMVCKTFEMKIDAPFLCGYFKGLVVNKGRLIPIQIVKESATDCLVSALPLFENKKDSIEPEVLRGFFSLLKEIKLNDGDYDAVRDTDKSKWDFESFICALEFLVKGHKESALVLDTQGCVCDAFRQAFAENESQWERVLQCSSGAFVLLLECNQQDKRVEGVQDEFWLKLETIDILCWGQQEIMTFLEAFVKYADNKSPKWIDRSAKISAALTFLEISDWDADSLIHIYKTLFEFNRGFVMICSSIISFAIRKNYPELSAQHLTSVFKNKPNLSTLSSSDWNKAKENIYNAITEADKSGWDPERKKSILEFSSSLLKADKEADNN